VRISGHEAARAAGVELAERARTFAPEAVLCVLTGGAEVGSAIAEALGVPMYGIDLRYRWSRLAAGAPAALRPGLWPLKELAYRIGRPRVAGESIDALPRLERAVLVDDSASSGRTLRAAMEALERRGLGRGSLFVAAIRCGPRAKGLVDAWITDRAIW
jgi:hypoxanthine phosphoribosyltransferase